MTAPVGRGAVGLHRGRLVLGVLMVLLAALSLLRQAGVVSLELRYVAPALVMAAGLVLLLSSASVRTRT